MFMKAAVTDKDLPAIMGELYRDLEIAAQTGMGRAGLGLQRDLRQQVRTAGLGQRLANAWRLKVYPENTFSANAAAAVDTKAPELIRAFDEGATIRSKNGFFLAIPSSFAPKRGIGGKRLTPSNFPEGAFGPLRFIYRRPSLGPSMLVVDNLVARRSKRGGFRRQRNKQKLARGASTFIPMFFLYPQVKLRKRLSVKSAAAQWQAALPGIVNQQLQRLERR